MVRLPAQARPLFPFLKPVWVATTRSVAPLTARLARRRGDLLPSRLVTDLEQAARTSGGRSETVRPAERVERGRMQGLPPDLPLSDRRDGESMPAVRAAELPRGRVLGPHRAVITGNGALVDDVSRYFDTRGLYDQPLFLNPFPSPPLEVAGRLGVLAARGDANYYHFLTDVLPRIGVLEGATEVARPDRWYVAAHSPVQNALLDRLGIHPELRIDPVQHPHVRADTLVVPGLPASDEKSPPWIVEFLRSRLMTGTVPAARTRIYVGRGFSLNNRAVRNESEVRAVLAEYGFVDVDPGGLTADEQIRTFAEAELIVASHGAGLANLVFASPDTRVVELFPAGFVLPCYWRLACGVPGLDYRYLSAPPTTRLRPNNRQAAIVSDIDVDLAGLRSLFTEWLER